MDGPRTEENLRAAIGRRGDARHMLVGVRPKKKSAARGGCAHFFSSLSGPLARGAWGEGAAGPDAESIYASHVRFRIQLTLLVGRGVDDWHDYLPPPGRILQRKPTWFERWSRIHAGSMGPGVIAVPTQHQVPKNVSAESRCPKAGNAASLLPEPGHQCRASTPTHAHGLFHMTKKPVPQRTKKKSGIAHLGMMGDGTEEQNLGERGKPAARIKKGEVDAAFRKQPPKKS
jgi:hypothetical protein